MRRTSQILLLLLMLSRFLVLPVSALIWKPPPPTSSPIPTETTLPESSVSPTPTSLPELTPTPELTAPTPELTAPTPEPTAPTPEPTAPTPEPLPTTIPEGSVLPSPTPKPEVSPNVDDQLPYIGYTSINWYVDISAFDFMLNNFDGSMQLGLEISYDNEATWCSWTGPILVNPPYLRITFTPAIATPYYFRLVYPDGTTSKSKYVRIKESYLDALSRPNIGDMDGSDREPQPQPPYHSPSPTPSPAASYSPEHVAFYKSRLEEIKLFWETHAWLPPFYNLSVSAESAASPLDTAKSDTPTTLADTSPINALLDVPVTTVIASPAPAPSTIDIPSMLLLSPHTNPSPVPSPVTLSIPTYPPPSVSAELLPSTLTTESTPVNATNPLEPFSSLPSPSSMQVTNDPPTSYTPAFALITLFLLTLSISYFLWFKKQ